MAKVFTKNNSSEHFVFFLPKEKILTAKNMNYSIFFDFCEWIFVVGGE